MKRCSRNPIADRLTAIFFSLTLFAAMAPARLWADADPNQLLAFKKIFVEPVLDNVDGVFRAPVEESFKAVFDRNPRFELVNDKGSSDAQVKTSVQKKTGGIDLEMTMTLSSTGEVYSIEKTTVAAAASGRETGAAVGQLLKATLKRIPFYGTVTGRDGKEVTLDIGSAHGLEKGDIIQISRVDSIKRHPLLKSIVDVQLVPVGSVTVDEVEDSIAFGHVSNEITGQAILKFHKVTAIEARAPLDNRQPRPGRGSADAYDDGTLSGGRAKADVDEDRPTLGYVGLGMQLGQFSNSASLNAGATTTTGSAFSPGVRLNGELWITKRWFVDLLFGYSTMSYKNDSTSLVDVPGLTASTRTIGLNAGYKYLPTGSIYGPTVFAKVGYHNFAWDVPTDSAALLSEKTYSGINLGIGGTLPISNLDWGLMLNINMLILPSLSEEGLKTGANASTTAVNFFIGGYHYFTPKIAMRAGFQFESYSADFGEGATRSSTSQKVVGIVPSLLYYF